LHYQKSKEMPKLKRSRLCGGAVLLYVALLNGCSRQPGAPAGPENSAGDQSLPFDRASEKSGISPTGKLVPTSIPIGTAITVRLQTPLSSASSASGDSFAATLDESLTIDKQTIVPRGAAVRGKIVEAKASGHLQDPGYLRLKLTTILVNGKSYPLQTSSIFVKGASHEKRNLALIGGGAGAGALIGGVAGGGKGALIGSAVGAAGGTGAAYATGNKDVGFAAERRLTFRLNESLSLQD
jgi:hypothetical protein